ncbi:MAG TPA: radical SAM protein, partial [Fimbriimonas sp.]
MDRPALRKPFSLMAKPTASKCNLDCTYCYYLEKEGLYPDSRSWVMSDEVLERYVRETIEGNDTPEVAFIWQGGEPTLLGTAFFEKAIRLQRVYANGKRIA